MENFFVHAGYKLDNTSVDNLLSIVDIVKPGFRTSWEINYKEREGTDINWNRRKSPFVYDHLYKLDLVLDTGAEKIGFQITLDKNEVDQKGRTLEKFSPLYQLAKIDYTAVLLCIPGGEADQGIVFAPNKSELKDRVYKLVDRVLDGAKVVTFTTK